MAKITLDLNSFKASGVYTVEFDTSERIVLSTETIRLVVGFSRKGPFNAPVFLRDARTARQIFGQIDTFLEKRGSFFHRSIETCLQTGPVFALNLLPLNNVPMNEGGDAVEYRSFSLNSTEENGKTSKELLTSFYNKERFWFPDADNFIAIAENNALNKGSLFNLVNLGQTPMSFIIRKPNPHIQGYNITAREYYGAGNVPDYVHEFDFMEDYFVEIIMVEGNWTDYKRLSEDPVYSSFFDARGAKVDRLDEFLSLTETTVVGKIVGSVIPDFIDGNGSNQFIELLVNNAVGSTGVFLGINREELDDYANSTRKVDMVGHNLINTNNDKISFLSYNTPISKAIAFDDLLVLDNGDPDNFTVEQIDLTAYIGASIESSPIGGNSGVFNNILVMKKPAPSAQYFRQQEYTNLLNKLSNITLIKTLGANAGEEYLKVDQVIDNGTEFRVVLSNPLMTSVYDFNNTTITNVDTSTPTVPKITVDNAVVGYITPAQGDLMFISAPGFKKYFEVSDVTNMPIIELNPIGVNSVSGESELIELSEALSNGTLVYTDLSITHFDLTSGTSDDFLPKLTGTLDVVYEPDTVFIHENGSADEDYIEAYPGSKLAKDIKETRIVDGDKVYNAANTFHYLDIDENWGKVYDVTSNLKYGLNGVRVRQYSDKSLITQIVGIGNGFVTGLTGNESFEAGGTAYGTGNSILLYSSFIEDLKTEVPVISGSVIGSRTSFKITEANGNKIEIGYYLVNELGDHLIRVTGKVKGINQSTGDIEYTISTPAACKIESGMAIVFAPLNKYIDRLHFTHLSGFNLTEYHLPRTQDQAKKIYGVIENTNLADTLASKDIISFRYIIDTMKFGVDPMMGPKAVLSRLAKKRQKCMAILNAPSIKEFMESTDPRFTEDPRPLEGNPRPTLKTEYIASGGNLTLGPSFRFTLPDEENGAKFMGVFSPFLVYRDNNKNILVPPAADVSNNFIRKFLGGQPYAIVAGPRRGILSNPKLVGLEFDYTLADREFLEPFGINPIVSTRNVGIMIFGNQTAYQRTLSAFNNLHVRDLLITVEAAIEDILMQYIYEFNDATTRLEIRSIVEGYLEGVRNAGGVFDYDVIMDETNNTPETIDQSFGIIDVGIEPSRGMHKFINRISVLKTGTIASGGFTIA